MSNMTSAITMPPPPLSAMSSSTTTPFTFASTTSSTAATPPLPTPKQISEQIHAILYDPNSPHAWDFLSIKRPFSVSTLMQSKPIVDLLFILEPGPTVDWKGLRTNLAVLKPYAINTKTGPQLLSFFKSLIEMQASWLLVIARLEARRAYNKQLREYYVFCRQAYTQHLEDPSVSPEAADIAYANECQQYDATMDAGTFNQSETALVAELKKEGIRLVQYKISLEMWRYSAILWAMVDKYGQWQRAKQGDSLAQRAMLKERNATVARNQLGLGVDAGNVNEQQVWTVHGIES